MIYFTNRGRTSIEQPFLSLDVYFSNSAQFQHGWNHDTRHSLISKLFRINHWCENETGVTEAKKGGHTLPQPGSCHVMWISVICQWDRLWCVQSCDYLRAEGEKICIKVVSAQWKEIEEEEQELETKDGTSGHHHLLPLRRNPHLPWTKVCTCNL